MKNAMRTLMQRVPRFTLAAALLLTSQVWADTLNIATFPIATGSAQAVKPNLYFILDDSGSMGSDYTPDYVNDSICQDSLSSYGNTHGCNRGSSSTDSSYRADPPFMSGDFNKQYYNPAIRYYPPKKYDGSEWANADPADAVTGDIFRGSTSKTNLKTDYPDVYWCKNAADTAPGANCHNNEGTQYGYGYPNNVWSVQKTVKGAPFYYELNGSPTWCSNDSLTTCQANRSSTYKYPRFSDVVTATAGAPFTPAVAATRAKVTITVSKVTSGKKIQNVKCGKDNTGATAFTGTYTLPDSNNSTLANWLAGKLSACSNPAAGAWVIAYPSASGNNNEIDVSWPVAGAAGNGNKFYISVDTDSSSGFTVRIAGSDIDATSLASPLPGFTLSGGADATAAIPAVADVIAFPTAGVQFTKIVIDVDPASTATYTRGSKRTDCTTSTSYCTAQEELQNFANWYQYYRTRMLMMKTSVSRVFAGVSDVAPGAGLRVGFDVISNTASSVTQSVADFTTGASGNKKTFFDNLYAANPSSYTPLRGALSKAGRMYAGKLAVDPVQMSCQQNFTFLSTDGYWNTNIETSSYGPYKENNTDLVGNQDYGDTAATAASASLSVDTVNSGAYSISQIKCGTSGGTVSTINETYTVSGATSTERKANMAAWLATKLTQCTNPAAGPWQITYSGGTSNTIKISWPITGSTGNGQTFYLAIKVSSTSNIVTRLGGTTVSLSSIPSPVTTYTTLSGGANTITGVGRPYYDAAAAENTLADIAMYYWKSDLRTMTNDVKASSRDPATWQHMATFTMGLGIDGLLGYAVDYETGGSADYTALLNGTKDWPNPITNTTDARVDDLWHAAVNGHGQYFSASRPDEVVEQIEMAIASITAETGAGSGAATSALEPTQGDNYAYTASYRTQFWNGDLQAKEINLKDDPTTAVVEVPGSLKETASWSAAYQLGSQASRTLYTFNAAAVGTDKKRVLSWTNLNGTEKGYFDPSLLYQCTPIALCPGATSENLFNFLMGGADTTTNTSYRNRESVGDPGNSSNPAVVNILGDLVNSQPIFVGKPTMSYTENGYATFKNGTAASRGRTVYVGSNDGFLHAFNADTGVERWAYMPVVHLQNLYKIAGSDYSHQFYQDGTISVTDAYDGTAWRTILVSGMNRGGKYYFGLDVTDPTAPKAVWEFTDATTSGYSYGNPVIAKLPAGATDSGGSDVAGRWVALVTSGYNNTAGDGQGVLYVLDVFTGVKLFEMKTTSSFASSSTPVGLAKISAWADDPANDNTAKWVYGGDLNGDIWRFDLATKGVLKVAAIGEPITVRPALGEIDGSRVLFLGTGVFLQEDDKSDDSDRSIFAIKDTGVTQTNLKTNGDYVQQTLTNHDDYRTVTNNPVDWSIKNGWYVNLPDDRERVNLDPKLVLGTLIVPSNVPDPTSVNSCSAGGYSWKNQFDWKTGSAVATAEKDADGNLKSSTKDESLLVGFAVIVVDGDVRFIGTTADNKIEPEKVNVSGSASTAIRRISWRELVTD